MGRGGEEKLFNFLQVLCGRHSWKNRGCCGGNSSVPNCTIKTRLQTARGGSQIQWKGLYSGLGGNLIGVLPASALFVGIYEPTKRKLLDAFPENLSAVAHFTAGAVGGFAASLIRVPTEGYGSFLLQDLLFDAIQFCIYEQLRIGYKLVAKRELNDPENALIGAFAGTKKAVLWNCEVCSDDLEIGRSWGILEGHRAASAVDWHRRVHLLRRAGEDQVGACREEQPQDAGAQGRVNQPTNDDALLLTCSRTTTSFVSSFAPIRY